MRVDQPVVNVFARAPIPGMVKTRLATDIGKPNAVRIFRRLLAYTLEETGRSGFRQIVWIDGQRWHPAWRRIEGRRLRVQVPGDLGRRMGHAARWSLARHSRVVIVGSDCPGLAARDLEEAVERLSAVDVAIGPATDGGYYLIAMSRLVPAIFTGIPWGGPQVYARTVQKIRRLGLTCATLRTLSDVDNRRDLKHFR